MTAKGSWIRNFDVAFRPIFRISRCFQRSQQKLLKLSFSFTRQHKNSKTIFAYVKKELIKFKRLAKRIFICWPSPFIYDICLLFHVICSSSVIQYREALRTIPGQVYHIDKVCLWCTLMTANFTSVTVWEQEQVTEL